MWPQLQHMQRRRELQSILHNTGHIHHSAVYENFMARQPNTALAQGRWQRCNSSHDQRLTGTPRTPHAQDSKACIHDQSQQNDYTSLCIPKRPVHRAQRQLGQNDASAGGCVLSTSAPDYNIELPGLRLWQQRNSVQMDANCEGTYKCLDFTHVSRGQLTHDDTIVDTQGGCKSHSKESSANKHNSNKRTRKPRTRKLER